MSAWRKLVIGTEEWKFSIGKSALGIIDPRDGKRHNVNMSDFWLALGYGGYSNDSWAVGPGDIRKFVDCAYRGVEKLPEYIVAGGGPLGVIILSSLPMTEVERRVDASVTMRKVHLRGEGDGHFGPTSNPYPWCISPGTHSFYTFVADKESDSAAAQ